MKLYAKTTSDSGEGSKTRGGHRRLTVVLTADTRGGRSEVEVTMTANPDGTVSCDVTENCIEDGFTLFVPYRHPA